jgi:hypothetical protein
VFVIVTMVGAIAILQARYLEHRGRWIDDDDGSVLKTDPAMVFLKASAETESGILHDRCDVSRDL